MGIHIMSGNGVMFQICFLKQIKLKINDENTKNSKNFLVTFYINRM